MDQRPKKVADFNNYFDCSVIYIQRAHKSQACRCNTPLPHPAPRRRDRTRPACLASSLAAATAWEAQTAGTVEYFLVCLVFSSVSCLCFKHASVSGNSSVSTVVIFPVMRPSGTVDTLTHISGHRCAFTLAKTQAWNFWAIGGECASL